MVEFDTGFSRWERWAAHSGYVAEGVFYLPLGFFALLAAAAHRQPDGSMGALSKLGQTWVGDALLTVLAGGLAAFVLWQWVLAIADPEHRADRNNPRRRLARVAYLANGIFHCVFVGEVLRSIFSATRRADATQSQIRWTAQAFLLPVGRYAVALVGIGVVVFGLWQLYRAVTRDKNQRIELDRCPFKHAVRMLGVYGLLARGTLFGLVGGYLIDAAWRHDPRYSVGVAGALGGLLEQPCGAWLLGAMAVGLLCYGLYQILKEPYRTLGKT